MERKEIMLLCKKWFLPVVTLLLWGCASGRLVESVAETAADSFVASSPVVLAHDKKLDRLQRLVDTLEDEEREIMRLLNRLHITVSERLTEMERRLESLRKGKPSGKNNSLFSL